MTRTVGYRSIYLGLCLFLWLAPFFQAGWKKKSWPFLPHALRHQHFAAALFTTEPRSWPDWQLEIQRADGTRYTVDEREHFPMGAFGSRTRYDRIMSQVSGRRYASAVRRRLAAYVLWRERERLGVRDERLHLRLTRARWQVGHPDLATPSGAWAVPPSTELESPHRVLDGSYSLLPDDRIAVVWERDPASMQAQARRAEARRAEARRAGARRAGADRNITRIRAPANKRPTDESPVERVRDVQEPPVRRVLRP